jgi:hypothetical protein
VNGTSRNAECLPWPDLDWFSVNRPRQDRTGRPVPFQRLASRLNPPLRKSPTGVRSYFFLAPTCVGLHELLNGWHGPLARARLAPASGLGGALDLPLLRSARVVPGFRPYR